MTDPRELMIGEVPFVFSIADNDSDGVLIKGFASVEVEDREGEVAPPEEFNIEQFMATPAILVNHEFWRDSNGNAISVGIPKSLHIARLKKNREDKTLFNVIDEKTGDLLTVYPKEKVPGLDAGDRGLFAFIKVTEPDVAERVRKGEFTAFSWRGLTKSGFRVNQETRKTEKVLSEIDLFEISLVNVPANPQATFIMQNKTAYALKLDKGRFESRKEASAYLEQHGLSIDHIAENETCFFGRQLVGKDVDMRRMEAVKMAPGVTLLTAPPKDNVGTRLTATEVESVRALVEKEGSTMAEDAKTTEETQDEKKETFSMEQFNELLEKTISKALEGTASALEELKGSMTKSSEEVANFAKRVDELEAKIKGETDDDEEDESEETDEEEEVSENNLEEAIKSLGQMLAKNQEELAKTLVGTQEERDERLKSVDTQKKDPNSVFDTFFGIAG